MTSSQLAAFWPIVAQIGTALLPYVGVAVLAIAGWLGNEVRLHVHNQRVLQFINAAVSWAEATYTQPKSGPTKKSAVTQLVQEQFPSLKGSKLSALIEQCVAQLPQALPAFATAINGAPVEVKAPAIDPAELAGHIAPQLGTVLAPLLAQILGPTLGPALISALLSAFQTSQQTIVLPGPQPGTAVNIPTVFTPPPTPPADPPTPAPLPLQPAPSTDGSNAASALGTATIQTTATPTLAGVNQP